MASPGSQPKVTVELDAKISIEIADNGYLGGEASVAKHIEDAQRSAQSWTYLIQKGTMTPERVLAKVKVVGIRIDPDPS